MGYEQYVLASALYAWGSDFTVCGCVCLCGGTNKESHRYYTPAAWCRLCFWGGREGYATLLNTDTKQELDHLASFFKMAVKYADEIGFKGQFYIEPKPKEPTKHQYDFDVQTVIGFLKTYGLDDRFQLNIEANHATLASHTFQHELNMARINGMLGSVDANQGDMLLGWDTDQFPTNLYDATLAMYEILQTGGLKSGGLNFDAKVRRESFTMEDIAYAYIAGMDTYAKGLRTAALLLEDGILKQAVKERYESYTYGIGKKISEGKTDFRELSAYALSLPTITIGSGKQERLERILSDYLVK
ncbi:putative xylose isomerase [Erysipelotrichaceae bacterium 3_1_53]|nr:putative xylose isomerase [Erysipelotrichaceae bacterium 3_1_53]